MVEAGKTDHAPTGHDLTSQILKKTMGRDRMKFGHGDTSLSGSLEPRADGVFPAPVGPIFLGAGPLWGQPLFFPSLDRVTI
jgi:hypothetical protein